MNLTAQTSINTRLFADSCHICGSRRIGYRFIRNGFNIYQCDECGFVFLNPQPSPEALDRIYGEGYFIEDQPGAHREAFAAMKKYTTRTYLEDLIRYYGKSSGRLLEIGYGRDDFISLAKERGFDVTCAKIPEYVPQTPHFPAAHFDICVLFDVIEHVRDPIGFLRKIHDLLKDDGVLFMVLPSLDSWSAKLMKNIWMEFKAEHLHYFDSQTVQHALAKTGFHEVEISPNYKFLNLEYVKRHFRKFHVPFFTGAVSCLSSFSSNQLKKKHFKVVASGINVLSRKRKLRPRQLLSIVVPVYNEKTTFPALMRALLTKQLAGLDKEIIIVESNSTDGTRNDVLRYRDIPGVSIVLEDRPKGKGHAVRAGLARAKGDFVMIQDGDLEYDINDYDQLLAPLMNYSTPFVLGSRHGKGWKIRHFSTQPLLSFTMNIGHWFFASLLNIFCGSRLKDPFTMYKIFRRDCIFGLSFKANRFDFDWELVMKLLRKGHRPLEIPVNYNSRSFKEGKKVSFIKDPLLWIVALFRFRFEPLYAGKNGKR